MSIDIGTGARTLSVSSLDEYRRDDAPQSGGIGVARMRGGDCAAAGVRGGAPEARGVSSSAIAADAAAVAVAMVGDRVGVA